MYDPYELKISKIYCDRIREYVSREELLRSIKPNKPGIRKQIFTTAGDLMIRTGTYLKAQALHERPAQSPTIFL